MRACYCAVWATRFTSFGQRVQRLVGRLLSVALVTLAMSNVAATEEIAPFDDNPGPFVEESGSGGSYFAGGAGYSRSLDTVLRARYSTQSYGQVEGNLDLGTFKAFPFDDASLAFADAQITLSDQQGVGFNVGTGVRFLSDTMFTPDPQRILGFSVWADGTSTEADAFFGQVGVSFESLGDVWDLRANGYIPVTSRHHTGNPISTQATVFSGNTLGGETIAPFDTAFYAAEVEAARRLGNREAWGFAGAYGLDSGDDDTVGYRVGLRGYAHPDLLLQCAVSNDEIFNTNVAVSLTWFVGRTRTDYTPTCSVLDRLREPVLRNDYVVVNTTTVTDSIALTDADGNVIDFIHVDSSAPDGGDGTFENPLNNLDEILANSSDGNIVLAYSDSVFTGQSATLQDNQRFLGEGEGMVFSVNTDVGTVDIPETSPGARDGAKPTIGSAPGSAITLADNNEVANMLINGGGVTTTAIDGANADGVTDPNLHDLMIQDIAGNGISLVAGARPDTDDADGDGNTTELLIPFEVMVDEVMFDQLTGNDIRIDAQAMFGGMPVDPDDADVQLMGDLTVSNITSTNNTGTSLFATNLIEADNQGKLTIDTYDYDGGSTGMGGMEFLDIDGEIILQDYTATGGLGVAASFTNLTSDGVVNIDNMIYDGGTGTASALLFDNVDSLIGTDGVTVTNSSFMGGMGDGVSILNESDGNFEFQASNTFEDIDGTTFLVDGDDDGLGGSFTGMLTVNADITNDTGRSVLLQNMTGGTTNFAATFTGDITDTGEGIGIFDNEGTRVSLFAGDLDLDTETSNAIDITGNGAESQIDFGGDIDVTTTSGDGITIAGNAMNTELSFNGDIDITTTSGDAFTATGGGVLIARGLDNQITTDSGTPLRIDGMTIGMGDVLFDEVNLNNGGVVANAILLNNITGQSVTIGNEGSLVDGEGGTIAATTGDAISITNVENASINGIIINNGGNANAGVRITDSDQKDMAIWLRNLNVNLGDEGIVYDGTSGTGSFDAGIDNSSITGTLVTGLEFIDLNVDSMGGEMGSVAINNLDIDANGSAATAGVLVNNSNATINLDSASSIREVTGTALEVVGGTPDFSMAGTINNTSADSISITGTTDGTVDLTGDVTDTGTGITITGNTDSNVQLLGSYDLDTVADDDAILITGNTDIDVSVADIDVVASGAGRGFVATGSGDLTVVSSGTNRVMTDSGVGLEIDSMNIVGQAVFDRVTVTNGATTGIDLNNVTGAGIVIGNNSGAAGSLDTMGTAISLTNVSNVTINNTTVAGSGGSASIDVTASSAADKRVTLNNVEVMESGIPSLDIDLTDGLFRLDVIDSDMSSTVVVNSNSDGDFGLLWDDSTIDTSADTALRLNLQAGVGSADIVIRGMGTRIETSSAAAGAMALDFDVTGTGPDVDFSLDDAMLQNTNSTGVTADFTVAGGSLFDANIRDNTFINGGVGDQFQMTSNGGSTVTRLFLRNNTAANFALVTSDDTTAPFNFRIVDSDANFTETKADNTGTVTFSPAEANFQAITGPIPEPVLP